MIETIPIVVFAYRRPDLLAQTLESLRQDRPPLLYVFCDGAKGGEEAEVSAARKLVNAIDWCETVVTHRAENMGLGRSVLAGVTAVFENHEAIIVFEDDLVCVPGTYSYLVAALNAYRHEPRVMSATAWTHPAITPSRLGDEPYLDGKAECWAWATWRRSWAGMDRAPMDMLREGLRRGLDVARYGPDMPVMAAEAADRNLWAIGWWYHHLLSAGLCLRPPHSMVEHIGWDSRATTTLEKMKFWLNPPLQAAPPVPARWPLPIEHPDVSVLWRDAVHATAVQRFPTIREILEESEQR